MTSSSTVTHLSSRDIAQIPIPVPSTLEQEALAEILELADERKNSSREHLSKALRAIERFRQAALFAACSGQLTAEWRDSHTDSAAPLIEAIDRARSDRRGKGHRATNAPDVDETLPEGWEWTTVGALVDVATGATPLKKRTDYYNGTIPWVTSGAVNAGLITGSDEFITELAIKETNAKVFPVGTLLVAMYGEGQTRGRVAELGIAAATNQAVAALRFGPESEPLRAYLLLFFRQNYERMRQISFGGVQPNLSLGVIREMSLPLPPLAEQMEVGRRVDEILALASQVEARIRSTILHIETSSRAVLAKALAGGLALNE